MKRLPVVVTLVGGLLASSMSLAGDPFHSFSAKRQFALQVIGCMRKRMSNDKYVSYNQAAKDCKEEVTRQADVTPTGPLVAADTKH